MGSMAQTNTVWKKVLTVVSRTCVIAGSALIILSLGLFSARYNPYRLSFGFSPQNSALKKPSQAHALTQPVRISLPDVSIDLPIVSSTIVGQKWETTDAGVSYLDLSPIPGENGNSILYGHNWTQLLGPLVKAVPGQLIYISYADGSVKTFRIEATALVASDDVHILDPSSEPLLTLYTCAGFMDSKRFVVTARKV